jgi:hypothetical protein
LFGLAACHSTPRPIRGQITIDQPGQPALQPASVPVLLVEGRAAAARAAAIRAELEAGRRALDKETARISSEYSAARSERTSLSYEGAGLAEAVKRAEEAGNQAAITDARADLQKCDDKRALAANKEMALQNQLDLLETKRQTLLQGLFSASWPGVVARTMTDARGGFSFRAAAGKSLAVVACYGRTAEEQVQTWQWLVPVPTQTAAPLLLNETNRFEGNR